MSWEITVCIQFWNECQKSVNGLSIKQLPHMRESSMWLDSDSKFNDDPISKHDVVSRGWLTVKYEKS
jgi:hypothetical protein